MAKIARKAIGNLFRSLFTFGFIFFLKWLIVDYLNKGWDGYGHFSFYASVFSFALVAVADLSIAAWDLLTD